MYVCVHIYVMYVLYRQRRVGERESRRRGDGGLWQGEVLLAGGLCLLLGFMLSVLCLL